MPTETERAAEAQTADVPETKPTRRGRRKTVTADAAPDTTSTMQDSAAVPSAPLAETVSAAPETISPSVSRLRLLHRQRDAAVGARQALHPMAPTPYSPHLPPRPHVPAEQLLVR